MKHLYLILLTLCNINCFTQVKVDYEVSDKIKDTKFTKLSTSALTHDGQRIMIVKNLPKLVGKNRQKVQMLDQNMNIVEGREMEEGKILDILSMKEKSFFLFIDKNGGLYKQEIDENNFKGIGEAIKLIDLEKSRAVYHKSINIGLKQYVKPKFAINKDSTKLVILVSNQAIKNESQGFMATLFDRNISPIWTKDINLGLSREEYKFNEFKLGNDDAIYLSGVELGKRKSKGIVSKDQILIHRVDNSTSSKYSINLDEGDKYLGEVELLYNDKEKGIDLLAFIYQKKMGLEEVLIVNLDENLDESNKVSSQVRFQDFIVDENENADKKKTYPTTKQKSNLDIIKLSKLDEGRKLIIAERKYNRIFKEHDNNINTPNILRTYVSHYYLDVYVLLFDANDKLEWARKIPKYQNSTETLGLGISISINQEKAYILFNDDEKNADPNKTKLSIYNGKEFKNGICKVVQIDLENGETKEDVVFNLKDEGMYIEPENYFQMDDGSLIVMG